MTTDFDITPHIDDVTELVRHAGNRALEWFRRPLDVENKATAGFDPVTEADRVVERDLRAALASRFPEHEIMGEEDGLSGKNGGSGRSRFRWVIDPIDGTRAFIAGQPLWGTLLGFQVDRAVVAGWLHQPTLDETYVAGPGGGWLLEAGRRRPLQTSAVTAVADSILLCTHPSMFAPGHETESFQRVADVARLSRFGGDCINFASVAAGFADLVIENQLQPYDVIPLIPLIEQAGGVISDRNGDLPLDGGWVVASATEALHREALALLDG